MMKSAKNYMEIVRDLFFVKFIFLIGKLIEANLFKNFFNKLFLDNSTIPHHGHKREHTSVWFTPCDRSAILLNSKNTKDAIIFMMKELSEEKLALYKDPIKCDDYLDLF